MRRLHPRSAALRIGRAGLQGAFLGFFLGSGVAGVLGLPAWTVPLLVPFGALLTGGYALARYYRFRYEIEGDTLAVDSGVFASQSREIPLGRIQNVDIREGIVNRALGLAVVDFETAGGSTTEATLDAVAPAEAERLRRLVQRHDREAESAGRPERDDTVDGETERAGETTDEQTLDDEESDNHQEQLFVFTLRELLTYAVVSIRPAAPVLTLVSLPLGLDIVRTIVRFNIETVGGEVGESVGFVPIVEAFDPLRLASLAALTVVEFIVVALLVSIALTVVEYYGFQLTRDGDDLRYQRGLLRRYSGTIPLSKVQSIRISENVLMRRFGFATLAVETAGYSGGNQQDTNGVAVPMAPQPEVAELARDIEPFGELEFQRPPKRARRRYAARFAIVAGLLTAVAYAVDTLLVGTGYWWLALGLFALVPPAAHLRWRHRGFALDDDVLVTRSGFWKRTINVVPYYRIQTVFVGRSPFQRRRNLATVTADTASTASVFGGSARAHDLDETTATELRDELRTRLYSDLAARRVENRSRRE